MAGFGPAFAQSFSEGNERLAKRKDDLFKMTYADYINRRDKYEEWTREDAKSARKAEAIVERSGIDPRAYPFVYKQVKSGMDDEALINDLRTGRIDFNDEMKTPDQKKDSEASGKIGAPKDVDSQMQGAGMGTSAPQGAQSVEPMSEAPEEAMPEMAGNAPTEPVQAGQAPSAPQVPQTPQAPQAASAAPTGPLSGIRGMFSGMKADRDAQDKEEALGRVAQATNTTPGDVAGMMSGSGYKSPEVDTSGISFTPAAPAPKADPIASLNEAYIERDAAVASGNPQRIATAERRLNSVITAKTLEAELDAKAKGITLEGAPATVWKQSPNGQPEYQKNIRVKKNPDGTFSDMMTGQPVDGQVVPVSKDEQDAIEKINTSLQKPMADQTTRISNTLGAVRTYNTMADIVKKTNGAVLAPVTSSMFQTGEKWVKDATVFAEQITKLSAESGEALDPTYLANLEAWQDKLLTEGGDSLGTQKGLFEVQKAIMAYRLGTAMGQEGRSLAESERKLFTDMAAGGVTPDRFHQGMADILMNNIRTLDTQTKQIVDSDFNLRGFKENYGYVPKSYDIEPLESQIANSSDPEVKTAYGYMKQFDRRTPSSAIPKASSQNTTGAQDNIPVVNSPQDVFKLPSNVPSFKTPDGRLKKNPNYRPK